MENTKAQLEDFLRKCEEVKNCKFIMATTKIKDLLKSIVNSAELYELFNTVAANFDYVAAKQKCFKESDNVYGQSKVVLPDTVGDRLAFIFCLLVEFDRNDINFNAFLQKYYPKDGSYYASYHLFCDEVIGSLEAIICDIFRDELVPVQQEIPAPAQNRGLPAPEAARQVRQEGQPVQTEQPPRPVQSAPPANAEAATEMNAVCMLIDSERESVKASELVADEKEAGLMILESLAEAVRNGNAGVIKSLTCGYNYFVMYNVFVSDSLSMLFETLGEYLAKL